LSLWCSTYAFARAEGTPVLSFTFTGTVLGVELIGASERKLESSEPNAKFVVVLRVDAHPKGGKCSFPLGAQVAFAVHSPSKTFGEPLDQVLGRKFAVTSGETQLRAVRLDETESGSGADSPPKSAWVECEPPHPQVKAALSRGWTTDPDPAAARSVVVVRARTGYGRDSFVHGNGVLIEGGGPGSRWVLTVAHVVQREGVCALEARVGLFRESFREPLHSMPGYVECVAKVLHLDTAADLALLDIPVREEIFTVAVAPKDTDLSSECRSGISIMPYGCPRAFEVGETRGVEHGQSGSPMILDGRLVRVLKGYLGSPKMCSLERRSASTHSVWADARAIQPFLECYQTQSRAAERPAPKPTPKPSP
jgi:hypothetical protein